MFRRRTTVAAAAQLPFVPTVVLSDGDRSVPRCAQAWRMQWLPLATVRSARSRARKRVSDRAVCCAGACAPELRRRAQTNGFAVLAGCGDDGNDRYRDGDLRYERRSFGMVHRRFADIHLCHIRHDTLYGSTWVTRTGVMQGMLNPGRMSAIVYRVERSETGATCDEASTTVPLRFWPLFRARLIAR
jgi:hypothetical protein